MSDEEIIKALKCCGEPYNICAECPMPNNIKDDCRCGEHLANYALDLITRKQTEIEQLKFEIAKLLPEGCPYATQVEVSNKLEAQIKSEAVKEFAERLKEKKFELDDQNEDVFYAVEMTDIDNLVKEMDGK